MVLCRPALVGAHLYCGQTPSVFTLDWQFLFFASRRPHTRYWRDWSSDVCSSDLGVENRAGAVRAGELFELNLTGFRVDLDLCNLNAQCGFGAGFKILVKAVTLDRRFRHARNVKIGRASCRERV